MAVSPQINNNNSSLDSRIASLLLKKDARAAYHLFSTSQKQLKPQILSRLLAIIPSGAETAHLWWPKAASVAQRLGSNAQPEDFAVLINIAAKANKLREVDYLWHQMPDLGIIRDTNVWNQYIAATCDADPRFWPWARTRTTSFASKTVNQRTKAANLGYLAPDPTSEASEAPEGTDSSLQDLGRVSASPTLSSSMPKNDVFALLEMMSVEGVAPNSRTFELVVLSLARQGLITSASSLIHRLWVGPDGAAAQFEVTDSTILAVVEAFGFNGEIEKGYELCKNMFDLSNASSVFWKRVLRISLTTNEAFFSTVWKELTTVYSKNPTPGEFWIRLEYLDHKCQFEKMFELVPRLPTQQLVDSAIRRGAQGLANTNRPLDALTNIRNLGEAGIKIPESVLPMLEARGVSMEQLQMFEEDDDEDSFV